MRNEKKSLKIGKLMGMGAWGIGNTTTEQQQLSHHKINLNLNKIKNK